MKQTLLITLTVFLIQISYAQKASKKDTTEYPLNDKDFAKMMIGHYGYTILGSESPATGLKVETTNPSIALSGTIYKNTSGTAIVNLDLAGGVSSGFMDIFSNNKLSGYYKGALNINWMTPKNSAKFEHPNKWLTRSQKRQILVDSTNLSHKAYTALIYSSLMDSSIFNQPSLVRLNTVYLERQKSYGNVTTILPINTLEELVRRIVYSYDSALDTTLSTDKLMLAFVKRFKDSNDTERQVKFIKAYQNRAALLKSTKDSISNQHIKTFKDLYSRITIRWVNFTPGFSNASFWIYNPTEGTLKAKRSFLPFLKVSFNEFTQNQKHKERFTYWLFGGSLRAVDKLEEFSKFNYKKSQELKISDTEKISKEETGLAYLGDKNEHGAGFDLFGELYNTRWPGYFKNFPGLYFKAQYTHAAVWRDDNRLSSEAGLIFNFTNNTKDAKNRLSVMPFAAFSNVLEQRKPDDPFSTVPLHDRFFAGIRFGVPINLGK